VLALLLTAALSACLHDGQTNVTLSGTVGVSTAPGDPAHGKAPYRYATLALDRPACFVDPSTNRAVVMPRIELVGTAPNKTLPFRFKGRHVTVTGRRLAVGAKAANPLPAILYAPMIARDPD
jgi:hypothetical protein